MRKEGQLAETEVKQTEESKTRFFEIFLVSIYTSTRLSIYLSPPPAFKTSVLLTLIAWCHIFIPQKALEKPLSGWGK